MKGVMRVTHDRVYEHIYDTGQEIQSTTTVVALPHFSLPSLSVVL